MRFMRLGDSRRSDNVEDQRGAGVRRRGVGLGLGAILLVVAGYFMGIDPRTLVDFLAESQPAPPQAEAPAPQSAPASDHQVDFVRAVLGETEDVWSAYFARIGRHYADPKLVLFTSSVASACGFATAAAGPFYCPSDQKIYVDLTFFRQLASDYGAPGAFAQAYVIAHEVGHHVQNLLGVSAAAARLTSGADRTTENRVSVEMELQADCFAGVWAMQANAAHKILDAGDMEQGLRAAAAVGDDTLQSRERSTVVPDSFTHGTSAQRMRWFRRGFDSGKIGQCDTFSAGASL